MAKASDVKEQLQNPPALRTASGIESMLKDVNIKGRFEAMLGKKAAGFMSSIISLTNQNKLLKTADPKSVLAAAAIAASLDLPINPSLGMAYIVPYSGVAQFQMGWKGFVQLAMRSGQYLTMNVAKVYEGQLVRENPFTGEFAFDADARKSDVVVGYVSYFKLLNGFEKYMYISKSEMEKHGKRYSKSYSTGQWTKDFDSMALKTVIKQLLSKWGILSIEMQTALQRDQVVAMDENKLTYADSPEGASDAFETLAVDESPLDDDTPEQFGTTGKGLPETM